MKDVARRTAVRVAAPRVTTILAVALGIGLFTQGVLAGGIAGGHHSWVSAHQDLGDFLIVLPLSNLVLGLLAGRRSSESRSALALRAMILASVVAVIVTGHAGGIWLAVHVPAAVATVVLVARQLATCVAAQSEGNTGGIGRAK